MRVHADIGGSLDAVVADMRVACSELEKALHDERDALDRSDADALDAASARKAERLQALEALDAERRHLAAHPDADPQVTPAGWDALVARLDTCQRLNTINGRIVESRLTHVREAIAVITGSERGAPLYGPAGKRVDAPLSMTRSRV